MGKYKDLDALLWQQKLTHVPVTPARVKPPVRLIFDADRFRWYFKNRDGLTIQDWRNQIDKEILRENAEYSAASQTNDKPSRGRKRKA